MMKKLAITVKLTMDYRDNFAPEYYEQQKSFFSRSIFRRQEFYCHWPGYFKINAFRSMAESRRA